MEKTIRVERKFTDEERAELCSSPYVASAMSNLLKFTLEFKRIAYQEMLEGKTMTEIFREHGIDPEILGSSRINYYAEEIRKWINSGKSFEEIHNKPKRKIVRPVVTSPQKRFTSDEQIELLCNPYVFLCFELFYERRFCFRDRQAVNCKAWFITKHANSSSFGSRSSFYSAQIHRPFEE